MRNGMRRDILRETQSYKIARFPEEDEEVHHSVPRFFTTLSEDIGDRKGRKKRSAKGSVDLLDRTTRGKSRKGELVQMKKP
jgi:hypothetical protein